MNNGEETRENVSEVASPDPFDSFPPKSDGRGASPASLSQYSSCGESKFERYCSANSVMGTPCMRSSHGTFNDGLDAEFGSLESLGFGDDVNFENFSLVGDAKISTLGDRRIEFCGGRSDGAVKVESGCSGLRSYHDNISGVGDGDEDGEMNSCEMVSEDKVELEGIVENVLIGGSSSNSRSDKRSLSGDGIEVASKSGVGVEEGSVFHVDNEDGLDLEFGTEFDKKEMEGEEDGTSSRYEHSEGEDSMYNCGSDEDHRNNFYYPRNAEYRQEAKSMNENPLAMNSHVAFGSEDWDDFEQEVVGSTLSSLILDKSQEKKELNLESERNLLSLSSVALIDGQKGQRNDVVEEPVVRKKVQGADESEENIHHSIVNSIGLPYSGEKEHAEEEKDTPLASYQVQSADILAEDIKSSFPAPIDLPMFSRLDQDVIAVTSNQVQGTDICAENTKISCPIPLSLPIFSGPNQDVRDISVASNQVIDASSNDVIMYHNNSISDIFEVELDPLVERAPLKIGLDTIDYGMEQMHQNHNDNELRTDGDGVSENQEFLCFKEQLDPLAEISNDQLGSHSIGCPRKLNAESFEACEAKLSSSTFENNLNASKNSPASADLVENLPASTKRENLEPNDFYDEVVHEMEEILLDYNESRGARFSQGNQMFHSQLSLPPRDGGATASTSGTDDAYPLTPLPLRIDGVEVVGAKQKRGDVSLSERLVGVKEYTVYKIRVWSGKDQWEVERRYRDFFTLYRRLKSLFDDQGWILPSLWSSVEKGSWKIFGNASPDVVAERSLLIQECLRSVLHSSYFSSHPSALLWFLSPQESVPSSPSSNTLVPHSTSFSGRADAENISTLGKTISLIVAIQPHKSMKQMLDAQHFICAGCHKYFDEGTTLTQDFIQTLGWGKPRLCEYTGQLFCSSCHTNDTAVLPARVLHHWDFTRYPVSQLAKSYLDSVNGQPMLCVSAVNPFLYSKVPALQHVMSLRKKIGTMLPYVHCPFRRSIYKGLGSRRYLLECNDFFALRDLIDLSKGPFAALPVMVENVSRKILEHITVQCLVCCDVGVPCSARQACNDPSSLIFAFQEDDIDRCKTCEAVFHKPCFKKITYCPCGASLGEDEAVSSTKRVSHSTSGEASGVSNLLVKRADSGLSVGLLSGLFSKAKPEKTEHKDSDNIMLMGSLPTTSL